jgi:thioredoxin 1
MLHEITDLNFEEQVLNAESAVLLSFGAAWCTPCKNLYPTLERIGDKFASTLKIGKVDVEAAPETQDKFVVRTIPTIVLVRNGEVLEKIIGARKESDIIAALRPHLDL